MAQSEENRPKLSPVIILMGVTFLACLSITLFTMLWMRPQLLGKQTKVDDDVQVVPELVVLQPAAGDVAPIILSSATTKLFEGDPFTLSWTWLPPLAKSEEFAVYLVWNGRAYRPANLDIQMEAGVYFASAPVTFLKDGVYAYQVRLLDVGSGEVIGESISAELTILPPATQTPTPSTTPIVIATRTPVPTPEANEAATATTATTALPASQATAAPVAESTPLPTSVAPTAVSPTAVPPTAVPPTAVPPTAIPPTAVPPTAVPPTAPPIVPTVTAPTVAENTPTPPSAEGATSTPPAP